jgi:predicted negative regulator of RcsB-dependent stress response
MSKLNHKDLKRPDRFQSAGLAILTKMMQNKQWMLGLVAGVLGLVILLGGWSFWQSKVGGERRDALASIEKVYAGELKKADDQRQEIQTQLDKLEADSVPKEAAPSADPKAPAINAENMVKKFELEARLKLIKADHSDSLPKFREFFTKHAKSSEGWLAGMRASSILMARREFPAAKEIVQGVMTASKGHAFYQIQSRMALVGLLEEEKDFDGAVKLVDEVLPLAQNDGLKAQALWVKANALQLKGDKVASETVYKEIIEKFPTSRESGRAKAMISIL